MKYEVVNSKRTYEGKIVSVREDVLILPNGKQTKREIVDRFNAAGILPVDSDGNIVFVRQYRHAFEEFLLEIPAGMIEKGENPLECIGRELEEETGYYSNDITFVCEIYPSVGFCTEKIFLYTAKNLIEGKQNFDDDEFIEIEKYSLQESVEMIFNGKIKDAKTIAAILAYKLNLTNI